MCLEPWEDFCRFPVGEAAPQKANGAAAATAPPQTSRWSLDEGRWVQSRKSHQETCDEIPLITECGSRNPFVAFKRLVDITVHSLVAPVSNIRRRKQEAAERKRISQIESNLKWYGRTDVDIMPRSEGVTTAINILKTAEDRTLDVSPQAINALFDDDAAAWAHNDPIANAMLAFGGACYFLPEIGDRLPSTASLFHQPPRPPRWLSIKWFKESPYSPVVLGGDEELPGPSGRWRGAFEDLMEDALGRSTDSPGHRKDINPSTSITSSGSGLDWLLSLQLRGILPPLLPSLRYSADCRQRYTDPKHIKSSTWSSSDSRNRSVFREFDHLVEEIRHSGIDVRLANTMNPRQASLEAPNQSAERPLEQEVVRRLTDFSIALDSAEQQTIAEQSRLVDALCQQDYAAETLKPGDHFTHVEGPSIPESAVVAIIKTSHTSSTPDGSVLTRISMTRRFEDGTEITDETVHTGREG